ncbi:GtrA family protein [Paenibacillus sp. QZ-Y1]|uniref:GtrA family protein n=1 Tax=Paenibacillus sp. QZ-Y1 TaxID=3414511 RepID=UPI003F7B0F9F
MKKLSLFIITSGFGWLLDMAIFFSCVHFFNIPVIISNFFSAGMAVIFVFFLSTKHIFQNVGAGISLKLVIYISFQLVSIFIFSIIIEWISSFFVYSQSVNGIRQITAKMIVTPLSLITNFIVMKYLIERIGMKKMT